jgi:hypothetical protein
VTVADEIGITSPLLIAFQEASEIKCGFKQRTDGRHCRVDPRVPDLRLCGAKQLQGMAEHESRGYEVVSHALQFTLARVPPVECLSAKMHDLEQVVRETIEDLLKVRLDRW